MRPGDLLVMRHPDERWGSEVGDPTSTRGPPILTPRPAVRPRHSVRIPPGTPLLLLRVERCFAHVLHEGAEYSVEVTWVRRA
jgi:hypothetical protein